MGPVKPTRSPGSSMRALSKCGRNRLFYISVFACAPIPLCFARRKHGRRGWLQGSQRWHPPEVWQKKSQQGEANRTYCRGHRLSFFILTSFSEGSCYCLTPKVRGLWVLFWTVILFYMCRNRIAGEAVRILPGECAGLLRMKTHPLVCASESSPLGPPVASSSARRL